MRRDGIDYYDWAKDDETKLIQAISDSNMSKTNYTMESKINILHDTYVTKSIVLDVYFDDMINCLGANKDIIEYIEKIKKEWGR